MTQVLYRKWRPKRLDEVVGQGPVTQTIRNAVSTGRVAHAYLFCGPRGTGKTSTARILAKAVNCLAPKDGEPDNACEVCESINEARALDLIEIDAASNRGIDDIRNLREKVHFSPNQAKYKVYIVDEAHMLTEAAFNALLKTLEEPPAHAIFVLATTEVHKVPLTIISRCQRFDFRRVPLETVVERLGWLCEGEEIEAEEEALQLLARTAGGSLRDAENLLERAIVSYGSPLTGEQVRDLLELGSDERALDLVEHIVKGAVPEGLTVINDVASQGGDVRQFHRVVTEYLRAAMLAKSGALSAGYSEETDARVRGFAEATSLAHLVHALKLFARADARREGLSSLPLELALVQSGLPPEPAAQPAPSRQQPSHRPAQPVARPTPRPPAAAAPSRTASQTPASQPPAAAARPPAPTRPAARAQPIAPEDLPADPASRLDVQWDFILRALRGRKGARFDLGALLRSSTVRNVHDDVIVLKYSHASHMERMQGELADPESRLAIREVFAKAMDGTYDIEVELSGGGNGPTQKASRRSHLVRALQGMGATVVSETEVDVEPKHAETGPEAAEADGQPPAGA